MGEPALGAGQRCGGCPALPAQDCAGAAAPPGLWEEVELRAQRAGRTR